MNKSLVWGSHWHRGRWNPGVGQGQSPVRNVCENTRSVAALPLPMLRGATSRVSTNRQSEKECRSFARFGISPDATARAFNNAAANSQPDPRSGVFVPPQAHEWLEDCLRVFRRKSYPVISNGNRCPAIIDSCRENVHMRFRVRHSVFDRVADEIEEQTSHLLMLDDHLR